MQVKDVLNFDENFYHSTLSVSIDYFLQAYDDGDLIFDEEDVVDVPLSVSVYKCFRHLPIVVVELVENIDGQRKSVIMKGSNEIKNIIKWIKEDVSFELAGHNARFSDLSDNDKHFVLKTMSCITLCLVRADEGCDMNKLKELIRQFC